MIGASIVLVVTLVFAILLTPFPAETQQAGKFPRIGYLSPGSIASHGPLFEAFRHGLRQLGYTEGQNLAIETRWADGKQDRLPNLAAELVRLEADIIVTSGTPAALAAKHATRAIPIVVMGVGDAVASGLVASLARPGGNVTGLSLVSPDLSGKRLQLLTEIAPGVSRIAVLWNAANPTVGVMVREVELGAQALRVQLQSLEVRSPDDFERAFAAAIRGRTDALLVMEDPLTVVHRKRIVDLTAKSRLPAIYGLKEFVEAGGLMSYGASLSDLHLRAAVYVDKVLKGAKPADLPVEQPVKFELFINAQTAKTLRLTIPQSLMLRADRIIE